MMVALAFPAGARREFPDSITGLEIANGISPSLAKRTVAMALDGVVRDLSCVRPESRRGIDRLRVGVDG